MKHNPLTQTIICSFFLGLTQACGGYGAADEKDVEPRDGEIAGVLVNDRGKSQPDSTVQLFLSDGTEPLKNVQGIDSDGIFGFFPPDSGTYNVVGIMGDLDKAIAQNIVFTMGSAINIGKIQTQKVAGLTVHVKTPDGVSAEGILVEVLGYNANATTITEGVGAIATGIPAGTYSVRFSRADLQTLIVPNVAMPSGEVKLMDDVNMLSLEAAN